MMIRRFVPVCLWALVMILMVTPRVWAQEAQEGEEEVPGAAERAEARAAKVALIKEKLQYFAPFVGEWVGSEEYFIVPEDVTLTTTDEWKGAFSLGGTHFEMHGTGVSDDGPTTYQWICTYDAEAEIYRAWYFDSDGNREVFEMDWDDDKKALVWTSAADESDRVSTFFMKVEGHEIKGEGETSMADGRIPLIKHSMSYKKRRIKI